MDAVEFVNTLNRMCKAGCMDCPNAYRNNRYWETCVNFRKRYPDEFISNVEQWAKEHSVMTNAMKFEEVFGRDIEDCLIDPKLYGMSTTWWDDEYKEPSNEQSTM